MNVASGSVMLRRGRLARRLSLVAKALVFFAVNLTGWMIAASADEPFTTVLGGAFVLSVALVLVSYAVWLTETSAPGEVRIAGDDLVVRRGSSVRALPRRSVLSAYVVRRALGTSLELTVAGGDALALHGIDPASAQAFVAELGFGPGGRRVRIDLALPSRRLIHPPIAFLAYMVGSAPAALLVGVIVELARGLDDAIAGVLYTALSLTTALAYHVLKRALAAPTVTVGSDGVLVTSGFRRTYVPRGDLAAVVQPTPRSPLVLERRRARNVAVLGSLLDSDRRGAAGALIRERLVDVPAPSRAALFDAPQGSVAAWRARLREALDAGYRAAGSSIDDAREVLTSAASTPDQRVGAALALRIAGEPPERIRVAAEAAVDPRLRVALEAVADDADDARVEAALRKIAR